MARWQDPETPLIWLTTGSLLLLGLIVFIFFLVRTNIKRIKREAKTREDLLIKHQKELLHNTIKGQEKERQRLSAELHDGIASKLNIIHLKFDSINRAFNPQESFHEVQSMLTETIEETRRISYELMPVTLEKFGLIVAFQELCDTNSNGNVGISFETNLDNTQIPNEYATHLYRIVQELVNNSLKYARCSRVQFSLNLQGNFLILSYKDNGIGRKENMDFNKGLGLRNIKGRMALLNGEMATINDSPGLRFEFKMTIPKE